MKELKVQVYRSEYSPNLIAFMANFCQDNYTFLENRNFKTESIKTVFKQLYIYLDSNLDLKYFKMEIL